TGRFSSDPGKLLTIWSVNQWTYLPYGIYRRAMKDNQAIEADTRSAVLREAASLFAAHGYDAVSVREIVAAAGVTKPALYYHFGNKEGVARALVEEFLGAATAMRHGVFGRAEGVRDLFETY